jgi:hypothetical protein
LVVVWVVPVVAGGVVVVAFGEPQDVRSSEMPSSRIMAALKVFPTLRPSKCKNRALSILYRSITSLNAGNSSKLSVIFAHNQGFRSQRYYILSVTFVNCAQAHHTHNSALP